ncbi:hypothetical protein BOM23_10730 [Erwinia sp. OLMDLW33]|nr:hypothetical protein BOM23_10730 [Erwinia sp. OLMDLW33]
MISSDQLRSTRPLSFSSIGFLVDLVIINRDCHASGGQSCTEQYATAISWHCCKVRDEVAFCLINRPHISKILLIRRISPRRASTFAFE